MGQLVVASVLSNTVVISLLYDDITNNVTSVQAANQTNKDVHVSLTNTSTNQSFGGTLAANTTATLNLPPGTVTLTQALNLVDLGLGVWQVSFRWPS